MTTRARLRRIMVRAAVSLGVCGILLSLLIALELSGMTGFALSLVLALLPVPLYVLFLLWFDRFEAEPPRLLRLAFLWGAGVAIFFAVFLNDLLGLYLVAAMGLEADAQPGISAVFAAPLVEEVFKGAALLALFFLKKDEFDGVVDGFIYAAMLGLGFATTENMLYYARAFAGEFPDLGAGPEAAAALFFLRGVGIASPFLHPLFTGMTGIGLGLARQSTRFSARFVAPLGGLAFAILLHFVWNISGVSPEANRGVYLFFIVPVFLGLLAYVLRSARREGHLIRSHLAPDVAVGLLGADELDALSTIMGRMRASVHALRMQGRGGWRARRAFHQAASEVALHRWRLARGLVADDPSYENRYRTCLAACRPALLTPTPEIV